MHMYIPMNVYVCMYIYVTQYILSHIHNANDLKREISEYNNMLRYQDKRLQLK